VIRILQGDALEVLRGLESELVHCCITSPPFYGLRDYGTGRWEGGDPECDHKNLYGTQGATGQRSDRTFTGAQNFYRGECRKCGARRIDEQIGLETTPDEYLMRLVGVFQEVRRVLRNDGTLWVNMGDSYCSDAGADRKPTTLSGARVPSGWTNRAQPHRVHALRSGKDQDSRLASAESAVLQGVRSHGDLKPKDLCGMPWELAFALRRDGWYLRSDIIWAKPNPMPESVQDRPTKSHEYVFLLSKSPKYFYDAEAIKEPCKPDTPRRYERGQTIATNKPGSLFGKVPAGWHQGTRADGSAPKDRRRKSGNKERKFRVEYGGNPELANAHQGFGVPWEDDGKGRNKRSVWTVPTQPTPEAHFATYPIALIEPCILAGSPEGGIILDPFCGAGTTGMATLKHGRQFIGIELNPEYVKIAHKRLNAKMPLLTQAEVSS